MNGEGRDRRDDFFPGGVCRHGKSSFSRRAPPYSPTTTRGPFTTGSRTWGRRSSSTRCGSSSRGRPFRGRRILCLRARRPKSSRRIAGSTGISPRSAYATRSGGSRLLPRRSRLTRGKVLKVFRAHAVPGSLAAPRKRSRHEGRGQRRDFRSCRSPWTRSAALKGRRG
jgi:hypothetical protein